MKRVLAILLPVCLLLPMVSTVAWAESSAHEKCTDVPFYYNDVRSVDQNNEILSYNTVFETPIDLTVYGYPTSGVIKTGLLGLQMDVCVSGRSDVVKAMETANLSGQLEITSSGTCDEEELSFNAMSALTWKANAWNRVTVDLGRINIPTGGTFDPSNFNYMRMYIGGLSAYVGQYAYVKIANVQIVDLTKPLSVDEAPALGDGTPGNQTPAQDVTLDAPAYTELASIPYSGVVYTYATGEVYAMAAKAPQAIDLTEWGYPTSGGGS